MPTIGEIAQQLGKTKGTVRNWIKKLNLEGHVSKSGDGRGTLFVDDYATSILASKLASGTVNHEEPGGEFAGDNPLIVALNAHISDLQKALDERTEEMKKRDSDHKWEIDAKDREIKGLREQLETALRSERHANELLHRVAGAGLWQRIAGFKGLLGDGSQS